MPSETFMKILGGSCGYMSECDCGQMYFDNSYNTEDVWDWDNGQLERVQADSDFIGLDYAPHSAHGFGYKWVDECDCEIKKRLEGIEKFLRSNSYEIVDFYNRLSDEHQQKADHLKLQNFFADPDPNQP